VSNACQDDEGTPPLAAREAFGCRLAKALGCEDAQPAAVLTHHIPAGWPRPNSTVHFVTDGIESAVRQAGAAAAGKSVGVHGADTIQQCLNAGLLDEIHVDIAAVLLGSGIRLFDHLTGTPAVLGNPAVIAGVGVTHLRYPVRKA
jgi:RibD domain-containing protein